MPDATQRRPFHLMAKPVGAICNLECAYCYFLSKEALFPGSSFRMSPDTLRSFVRDYLASQPSGEVTFAWQGGEPTLLGLEFFEAAVELQRRYRRCDQQVVNTIQTNGTKLDDDWCRFLGRHDFLVGISIDGPRELHDAYRLDKVGMGSFDRVMAGLAALRRHHVAFNVLTTVHAANQRAPLAVYRFLRDEAGARFMQFIPIVEPGETAGSDVVSARSVGAAAYGTFMSTIFDEWVRRDVGRVFVQLFDVTLGAYVGAPGGLCVFDETCGGALALEHTGDVYACDHFVDPEHHLGNLMEHPLAELAADPRQRAFGSAKRDALPTVCRSCEVRWLCHGGCPKDRIGTAPSGEAGLNYLCEGYRRFFRHSAPLMRFMAEELRHHRPPANVMRYLAERDAAQAAHGVPRGDGPGGARGGARVDGRDAAHRPAHGGARPAPSRNAPCPCGSGRKVKHCCGQR